MSESDLGTGTHAVEHEQLQEASHAPEGQGPIEVLFGAGGDPLVFGLPVFVSGSLVLGFTLIGFVSSSTNLGTYLPETTFAAGFGEFVTALWAIGLGQTIIAAIFGLFAMFWFSLFAVIMGIFHHWWLTPAGSVTGAEQMFFLAWLIIFFFLIVGMFRLPLTYIGIVVFVDIAVLCVLLSLYVPGDASDLLMAGGAAVFAFCSLGLYAFLEVAWTATGKTKPLIPLGPPIWK